MLVLTVSLKENIEMKTHKCGWALRLITVVIARTARLVRFTALETRCERMLLRSRLINDLFFSLDRRARSSRKKKQCTINGMVASFILH